MDFITPEIVSDGLGIFASFGLAVIVSIAISATVAGLVMFGVIKTIRALAGFGKAHADDIGYNERVEAEAEERELAAEQSAEETTKQKELVG